MRNYAYLIGLFALMTADAAFAGTGGAAMPWDDALTGLQKNLSGPTAGVISIVAVFAAGAALIFGGEMGEFTKRLIYTVIAVSLLVGGNALLTSLGILGALV
jgi:type IV secretion system protein VirB2